MGENTEVEVSPLNARNISSIDQSMLKRPLAPTDETSNSPNKKKKLHLENLPVSFKSMPKKHKKNAIFKYGNYDRYYGYRNTKDFKDIRLDAFQMHRTLFEGCNVLDIGCNNGLVTMSVARDFAVKRMVGIDIDKNLVNKARQLLSGEKRNCVVEGDKFPFNVEFKSGSYVLADEKLLNLEVEQFDTILCLSVIKWIHLNCGDVGVKLAFKRMFKQLVPGGRLILEAQEWNSYKRRKNLTPDITTNYKNIKFFPHQFERYLLGAEIGFESVFSIDIPKHDAKGFQRPIRVRILVNFSSRILHLRFGF